MYYDKQKADDFAEKHLTTEALFGFNVGDKVDYINDYGVKFENREIFGFDRETGKVHFYHAAYWFGVAPQSLTLTER